MEPADRAASRESPFSEDVGQISIMIGRKVNLGDETKDGREEELEIRYKAGLRKPSYVALEFMYYSAEVCHRSAKPGLNMF